MKENTDTPKYFLVIAILFLLVILTSTGDHGVCSIRDGTTEMKLELAHLVSRKSEPGEIVALNPDSRAASWRRPGLREARRRFQRRREHSERDARARHTGDGSRIRSGHGHDAVQLSFLGRNQQFP